MERVTNQLEREIYGITLNEQKRVKREFSIRLIEFKAWWETIGIQALWKSIEQRLIVLDIQRCILWAICQSQFGKWVQVKISPLIFLNSYTSPTWKRHIDLPTKSITIDRWSSTMTSVLVLTIWRRHYHILHSKAGMILTRQRFSTYCLQPISGEGLAEPIFSSPNNWGRAH